MATTESRAGQSERKGCVTFGWYCILKDDDKSNKDVEISSKEYMIVTILYLQNLERKLEETPVNTLG